MARIRIRQALNVNTPPDDSAFTQGLSGQAVTLTSVDSASEQSWAWQIVSTTDPSPPALSGATTSVASFTPTNGAHSYLIELTVDAGLPSESTVRRVFAIRSTQLGLRYPVFGESADAAGTLASNDPTASDDNEGLNWQGWGPDANAWLQAVESTAAKVDGIDADAAAQGAMLYATVTPHPVDPAEPDDHAFTALPLGTAGQVLTVNAGATAPEWVDAQTGSSGETNTASNLGAGEGVFAAKSGADLQFKSLVAGSNVTLTSDSDTVTIDASGGGEVNTASNLGPGTVIFASKSGADLRFKSLLGGANVTLTSDANTITINSSGAGQVNVGSNVGGGATELFSGMSGAFLRFRTVDVSGPLTASTVGNLITLGSTAEANTASNLGAGEGVFAAKSGVDLRFKSLVAGSNVTLTSDASTVTIAASDTGEANTASNLGAGTGVFASKSGVNLRFKSLVAGSNVTLTSDANTVTINASGGGGGASSLQGAYDGGSSITLGAGGPVSITAAAAGDAALDIVTGRIEMPDGFAIGQGAAVSATRAIAIGRSAVASGTDSVAIGSDLNTGTGATASGATSVALGAGASVAGDSSLAIGDAASAVNSDCVAIGRGAEAGSVTADEDTAVGRYARATGNRSTAIGFASQARTSTSTAIGSQAEATGAGAITINGRATGAGSFAFGSASSSTHNRSIALGQAATTTKANQLVIGGTDVGMVEAVIGYGAESSTPEPDLLFTTTSATTGSGASGTNLQLRGGLGNGAGTDGYIELLSAVQANGSVGAAGQVLTSRGPGLSPQWSIPTDVPNDAAIEVSGNTLMPNDVRLVRATGAGGFKITLPTAPTGGQVAIVFIRNDADGNITIDVPGGTQINNSSSISLPAGDGTIVAKLGLNWVELQR